MRIWGAMLALAMMAGNLLAADQSAIVYRGAKILTATGQTYDPGAMIVSGGKVVAVGDSKRIETPKDATEIDLAGKVIIPGLVDTHSHIGLFGRPGAGNDANETTGPVQSSVRALDSLNPFDPSIRIAQSGGVTTANIMPGSANVIGGQTIYIKLNGHSPTAMSLATPENLGGLKMANGDNPKGVYGGRGQSPATRMKVAAMQRSEFLKAQQYREKWSKYREKLAAGESPDPPTVDLAMEPLMEVLDGRRTVHFHTHRADDILSTLRLKEEFGFELVIQHGTEAFKVLDQIAKSGAIVSHTIVDSPGGKPETIEWYDETAAMLNEAGVKIVINTDDPVTDSRFLLRTAATAVRGGLPEETALRAVTLHAAQAMRLDAKIGSLEAGKDADFVVLSGEPFSIYTRVLQTYINGESVFDLRDGEEQRYQIGGFALNASTEVPFYEPIAPPTAAHPAPKAPKNAKRPDGAAAEFVVVAGLVHTVSGEPIKNGVVHVKDGKIAHVSPRKGFEFPKEAPVIEASAITPGLIDAYSSVPLSGMINIDADQEADEKGGAMHPDLRATDGFNPAEPLLRHLLANGITLVHSCPGRRNVIAGQSGLYRTHGTDVTEMTVRFPQAIVFNIGNAAKGHGGGDTRMGVISGLRKTLSDAGNFRRDRQKKLDKGETVEPDMSKDPLADLLDKKLPALFVADRADDLQTALRLSEEFHFDLQFGLGTEAFRVAEMIKQANVPVLVHPTQQKNGDLSKINTLTTNAAYLAEKEIPVALGSGFEGYVPKSFVVRLEAGLAAAHGLGFEKALKALTLDAAKILKVDDRFGSLEAGKVADIVLYDGDPLEQTTHVVAVIVDGKVVYDRATAPKVPLAERFYETLVSPPCCLSF
ncbi:amidohydrolase family protein [Blastopirellula sp. JC732]|uniref:Amidohydrolase family protein n=1 Tax=Blastopirellula sediminis TaxID=2894196 RepID=A0A9X1MM49_9BACT|nr:amidohydrolase family protein [Blastopirellula sediminis]MCC9607044.1 amidohydrolase family protein [Blastopirellula sediminis]MCC9629663.1 amidohydrolase family protein [Blastopirellula sediminis]